MTNSNEDQMEQYDYVDEDFFYEAIDDYAPLIGEFLMNFSLLERELNQLIAEIVQDGTHETGYVIVGQLNMMRKITIFSRLYLQLETSKDNRDKNLLENVINNLLELNIFRNKIAHADWGTLNKDHFVRVKISTDNETGYVKFKFAQIHPLDISDNLEKISETIEKMDSYRELAFSF